jgi:hypothetical protein
MKTTHKKLVGGLFVSLLITTVGAVFATAQTDDTTNDATDNTLPQISFGERHGMNGLGPYASELTDEQQTELEKLMTSLREQNASFNETRTAIKQKLDEFGVFDTQLDNEITQTEQRLTILNREKELRNEGYSWDEINNIIEDEFGLENTNGVGWNMMDGPRCGHGPRGSPLEFMDGEDLEQ